MALEIAVCSSELLKGIPGYQSAKNMIRDTAHATDMATLFGQGNYQLTRKKQLLMKGTREEFQKAFMPYQGRAVTGTAINLFMCKEDQEYLVAIHYGAQDGSCIETQISSRKLRGEFDEGDSIIPLEVITETIKAIHKSTKKSGVISRCSAVEKG